MQPFFFRPCAVAATPFANPLYFPLAPLLARLPPAPDALALAELARNLPVHTASGQALRFVPPQDDGLGYEARIAARGSRRRSSYAYTPASVAERPFGSMN